ncbi:MAG: LysM peptidoglycan-binding domain-containing protein [Nitrospirota bacterium]
MSKGMHMMRIFLTLAASLLFTMTGTLAWGNPSYTVKKGDNLYRISKKYQIGIEEIKKANNLKTKKIMPGMELTIPTGDNPAETTIKVASLVKSEEYSFIGPPPADDVTKPKAKTEPKTYKVKKGDSLWSIARKHSISIADLKTLNNFKTRKLKLGQVLIVAAGSEVTETQDSVVLAAEDESAAKYVKELQEISMSAEPDYSGIKEFLISVAQKTIGIPYKFGASSFKATDCSGYVKLVFDLIGIDLPRSAREQFKVGQSVDREDLSVGDLVFFQTYAPFPSHVGIYLGNNLFLHASSYAKKVTINSFNSYYMKRFVGAKRLEGLKEQASLFPLDNYINPD